MNALSRSVVVVIVLGICVISASAKAETSERINKPNLLIGDKWVVRTTDLFKNTETSQFEQTITVADADSIELERLTISSEKSENIGRKNTRKADPLTWSFLNPTASGGKYVAFSFPLESNKVWEYEYSYTDRAGNNGIQEGTARVDGWDDVKVPAGSFRAIKVIHKRHYRPNGNRDFEPGMWTETYWYAPEAKWWVKYEAYHIHAGRPWDHTLNEVVSFDVKH
jgi:hypothetical protein